MRAFERITAGILAMTLLAGSASFVPARAQVNPFTARPGHAEGLSRDDIDRLSRAVERLYTGRSIGTVERWRNPDTGNSGSVKLLRIFTSKDMPCRTMRYHVRHHDRPGEPDQFVVNWCRTASGEWKLTDPAP